ncbi:V-type ATPase [Thermothelomyces heterothallicus CBS 203.75]
MYELSSSLQCTQPGMARDSSVRRRWIQSIADVVEVDRPRGRHPRSFRRLESVRIPTIRTQPWPATGDGDGERRLTHRTDRTKRVREARDEARKEIEAYRAKKEAEYKAFEAQHTQGNKQAEEEANREAEAKIAEIKEAGKKNQDKIIKDLLAAVYEAHPTPAS